MKVTSSGKKLIVEIEETDTPSEERLMVNAIYNTLNILRIIKEGKK